MIISIKPLSKEKGEFEKNLQDNYRRATPLALLAGFFLISPLVQRHILKLMKQRTKLQIWPVG
ncbi:hypothetical protein N752_07550 [Desulforamulus aquiferis]|nr:hypothetical protein N752_07550 [Desulforamulus aquiferis]